jgi:hypothetical protein
MLLIPFASLVLPTLLRNASQAEVLVFGFYDTVLLPLPAAALATAAAPSTSLLLFVRCYAVLQAEVLFFVS